MKIDTTPHHVSRAPDQKLPPIPENRELEMPEMRSQRARMRRMLNAQQQMTMRNAGSTVTLQSIQLLRMINAR